MRKRRLIITGGEHVPAIPPAATPASTPLSDAAPHLSLASAPPAAPPGASRAMRARRVAATLRGGAAGAGAVVVRWRARHDVAIWLLAAVTLLALVPRYYGINWDSNNYLHPDEREIVFRAMCLTLPGMARGASCDHAFTGPGWFFSPQSPLNPHFFAYGSFPLYLLALVTHGLARLSSLSGGRFAPPGGGFWTDFGHFVLVGRALSALFDGGTVLLAGLLGRRLGGRWIGVLAAAFVAVIPFEVQVAHFYAVDTVLLFFVMLTLLAAIMLAQGPSAALHGAHWPESTGGVWRAWGVGLFAGVAFGLALATKVSALPLVAPLAVALALRWRRRGLGEAAAALLGLSVAAVMAFIITCPYALIDWPNFQVQVSAQTALAQGKLDYPYVRQFVGTTPFVYEIQQLLLYDMGLPLGLLGLAGFAWAVARLWRSLLDDWAVIVTWLVCYFAVVGSAYTKFTRYMLPVFAPLAVCGAAALGALAVWGTRRMLATSRGADAVREVATAATAGDAETAGAAPGRSRRWRRNPFAMPPARQLTRRWGAGWWRGACCALALAVLGATLLLTLALVNIYSTLNTRVQASAWIYNHIAPGSTLTYEVWDDPLPVLVPPARTVAGVSYTSAGHAIDPSAYHVIGLNLYDPDTLAKAQQMAQQLASANAVIISSQRLLDSIPKLPDRYPMTVHYYALLFGGQLGFKLAAHFTNQPHFLGFTFNDSGADESFSVYDHPPVWIFTRTGAGLSAHQILAQLTQGVTLPATSSRSGAQLSLLLPPAAAAADMQSAPLGVQFPATSLPNSIPVVWWLVVVELLGVFSFPLAFVAFPGLRDRGYGLSKLLGMLLLAYLVWLPSSLHLLPFGHWLVVGAFLALGLLGVALGWRRWDELRTFVLARWRLLAVCEGAFLVAFLFFVWVRALDPDLWQIYRGGEKPMELAFLDALLRSRTLPPADPWFSGGYVNYYYYGQYLFAVLIKLTGIVPTTAFNLAIPLLFAVTFTAAFSVVTGLVGRWWAGLAGGTALVVAGNLDGLLQLLGQWRAILAHAVPPAFDYWRSSRIIPYTINEFPYWSFLYADLHAHVIDLPVTVLLIAACASLLARARADERRWRPAVPTLAVIALGLGSAWCINTWDVPTYALLVLVVLALRVLPFGEGGGWAAIRARLAWPTVRAYALALALTLGAAYMLYEPFHHAFQNFVSGAGVVTTPTNPWQFATIFGLWLFLLVSFFFVELHDRWHEAFGATSGGVAPRGGGWVLALLYVGALALALLASVKVFLALLLIIGIVLALDTRHAPAKLLTYLLLLLGLAVALGVELIYIRDFLDNSPWERMNTVFKFYYQVWTCFALGGTLAGIYLCRRLFAYATPEMDAVSSAAGAHAPTRAAPWASANRLPRHGVHVASGRAAWLAALVLLVAGSSVFLVEGTQVRVQDPAVWAAVQPPPGGVQPTGLSLDGMAYMRGWYPGDYAAINWMNEHIGGIPTIVEASNGDYAWYGRVSIYTGLPDVLGWASHEAQQRYSDEVYARQAAVQAFYGGSDPNAAMAFLRAYQVSYVYLGGLERTCYMTTPSTSCVPMSGSALAKFDTLVQGGMLRVVYRNSDTTIYQVVGG